ncbi:hypothetical protein [uncultured Halomonas sp.]|uniref:hypothetical protein n=1 Tax=uncultured Halomonas sp. TaxID=173971 RepID=UPI00262B1707|nr:hypothetical protein [uncultured Halomonas sp.]
MGTTSVHATHGGLTSPLTYGEQFKFLPGEFTFSTKYVTNGEELDLSPYFRKLLGIVFEVPQGYELVYDHNGGKVIAYTNGNQVTAETDLKAALGAIQFLAWGL